MGKFLTIATASQGPFARVALNRPERRNALDGRMVAELLDVFEGFARDQSLRGIVLAAAGPVFCAGADIQWMQSAPLPSDGQAMKDARALALMFRAIDECPCPVIARVQGPAFGGGIGLLAACDMVVVAEAATFSLSEARLGLIPAVIAPYLLRKAGESFLRRYALSGDVFTASTAERFGLAHDVVQPEALDDRVAELLEGLLRLAPKAVRGSKSLFRGIRSLSDEDRRTACITSNADARSAPEAREGLLAFVEKRVPSWATPPEPGMKPQEQRSADVGAKRT